MTWQLGAGKVESKEQHSVVKSFNKEMGFNWWLSSKKIRLPMQETWVQSLGWEDPLENEMAPHSSILAWKNPSDRGT